MTYFEEQNKDKKEEIVRVIKKDNLKRTDRVIDGRRGYSQITVGDLIGPEIQRNISIDENEVLTDTETIK